MGQPNGTGGKGPCPYCGEQYAYNNYMRRSGDRAVYDAKAGRWLTDTHLIACHKKAGRPATPDPRTKVPTP